VKLLRPDFFIEIVERKMIENIILVQQIIGFLWLFSVYPSHPSDFTLKNFPGSLNLVGIAGN